MSGPAPPPKRKPPRLHAAAKATHSPISREIDTPAVGCLQSDFDWKAWQLDARWHGLHELAVEIRSASDPSQVKALVAVARLELERLGGPEGVTAAALMRAIVIALTTIGADRISASEVIDAIAERDNALAAGACLQ